MDSTFEYVKVAKGGVLATWYTCSDKCPCPAGRYASLVYTGIDIGIKANWALLKWGAEKGLVWDTWKTEQGDAFGARLESFLTNPDEESDRAKWETEVAIRLAEHQPQE